MQTLAQRIHRFGSPDVIELESIELPRPGVREVLVRIEAAGVGPWDALIRSGKSALPQPLPLTLGSDFAGVVLDAGLDAGHFAAGVEVFGISSARFTGAYARFAVVEADRIARKPASLDFIAAAAVPVVAVTAWKMLFDIGRLTAGQRVVVHGAAGSVGSLAVQLALGAGASVTALARSADRDRLTALGNVDVRSYDSGPFETGIEPVDLVLDTIGGDIQDRSYAILKRGGVLASIVAPPDQSKARERGVRAEFFVVDVRTAELERVADHFAAGRLKARVGLTLPYTEARRAHVLLDHPTPGLRGKIVLSMATA